MVTLRIVLACASAGVLLGVGIIWVAPDVRVGHDSEYLMTENGWPRVGSDRLDYSKVPGTNVVIPLQVGQPTRIMKAFASDYNEFVEPLRQADTGGWTATNSVATSNHLGGTAMDLNWNSHPFHVRGTFNASQMRVIRRLLDFYEGTIYWGGDWHDPIDEMHWQMGYDTYGDPHTQDFINRKIRSDGFSVFGGDNEDWTPVLNEVMGIG